MTATVLVVAPHADDETLGCGGAMLRHARGGDRVEWLLVTRIMPTDDEARAAAARREGEIAAVAAALSVSRVHRLDLPTAELDRLPLGELVGRIGGIVAQVQPSVVYLPFPGDAHSDHGVVFRAAASGTKRFRYPSVTSVRAYETLSETNFGIDPTVLPFRPNLYVDISAHLQQKLAALALYAGETGPHPFPRSAESVTALARLRGSEAGVDAAEAFMILREVHA